ncbi:MAG: aldo/keto reductase, partial [Desulfobacteraceae bacterium]|nr:aldo/keto reductase [Desulfobacteraceae bacterium]
MEKEIHISEYLRTIFKHKIQFIAFFIMTISITMLFSFLAEPVYQSTAKLIIDNEKSSSPITGERIDYQSYVSQSMTFNTHFKLIKSIPVINKLIDALNIQDEALEINPLKKIIQQFNANLKLIFKINSPPPSENEKHSGLINTIQKKIGITQIQDTRLLKIEVKDKNPVLAAKMANTLANKYIEYNLANKMESSKKILEWLNNEL